MWLLFLVGYLYLKHLTMKLFKDLRHMLTSGDNDKISSKRLITFLAFIMVSVAFFANLFFDMTVDTNIFDGIIQIVWAGLGVVVGEHLLKVKNGEKNNIPQEVPEDSTTEVPEEEEEEELGDN
jgi:hypothetical protein